MAQKVVLCGAGFLGVFFDESIRVVFSLLCLGSNIATAISNANNAAAVLRRVQISGINALNVYTKLKVTLPENHLLPPVPVDVTKGETLAQAF